MQFCLHHLLSQVALQKTIKMFWHLRYSVSRFARAFFKYSPFLSCTEEAVLALGQKVSDELKQLEPVEGKGISHSYIYRISIYYKHFFIYFIKWWFWNQVSWHLKWMKNSLKDNLPAWKSYNVGDLNTFINCVRGCWSTIDHVWWSHSNDFVIMHFFKCISCIK